MTTALRQYVNGSVSVSGDNLNTFEQTCDTAAQLRTLYGTTGMQVFLRGITAPADGGQGPFYWNASGTGPDDNLNIIVPLGSSAGVWSRIPWSATGGVNLSDGLVTATGSTTPRTLADRFAEIINVKDHGAVGNGVADDTAAIQAALTAVPSGGAEVFFPNGVYLISDTLKIKSYTRVVFESWGAQITVAASAANPAMAIFQNAGYTSGNVTSILDNQISIEGANLTYGAFGPNANGGAHAIRLLGVKNAAVLNCILDAGTPTGGLYKPDDAVALLGCDTVEVSGNRAYNFRNCMWDVWSAPKNITITNNFATTPAIAQMANFNPEYTTAPSTGNAATGLIFSNNTCLFTGASIAPLLFSPLGSGTTVSNVVVSNNYLSNCWIVVRGGVTGATISGNVMPQGAGSGTQIIAAYPNNGLTPDSIVVTGNTITNPVTTVGNLGVITVDATNSLVSGNVISGTGYAAPAIYTGTTNAVVVGTNRTSGGSGGFHISGSLWTSNDASLVLPNGSQYSARDSLGSGSGGLKWQSDDNILFSSTDASGNQRIVWSVQGRNSGSPLIVNPVFIVGGQNANQIKLFGAATGQPATIQTYGSDTNINLLLQPQGTGSVQLSPVATATMLASKAGTGAIGVDLSASTLTTAFKSTGFTVDGSGNITGVTGTLSHNNAAALTVSGISSFTTSGVNAATFPSYISGSGFVSGTPTPSAYLGIVKFTTTDQQATQGAGGSGNGFTVVHRWGGGGTTGPHRGSYISSGQNGSLSSSDTSTYLPMVGLGVESYANALSRPSVIVGSELGSLFGFNPQVRIASGAKNWIETWGAEFDVSVVESIKDRHGAGVVITATNTKQATRDDSAFHVGAQVGFSGAWRTAFQLGASSGVWGLDTNSSVMAVVLNAGNPPSGISPVARWGADLSRIAFSSGGGFLRTVGFAVDNAGSVGGKNSYGRTVTTLGTCPGADGGGSLFGRFGRRDLDDDANACD